MGVGWGHFLLFSLVTFQLPITQGRRGFEGAEDLTGTFSLEAAKDEGKNLKIVEKISHLPPNCVQLVLDFTLWGFKKKLDTQNISKSLLWRSERSIFIPQRRGNVLID